MDCMYDAPFLSKGKHNFDPLTPITFLTRSAATFPKRIAVVHGNEKFTYSQFYTRSVLLASSLSKSFGISYGKTVAALLSNTPPMLESHFGVPMTGGVLNTINTRLDATSVAYIIQHGESSVFLIDTEFTTLICDSLDLLKKQYPNAKIPTIIYFHDNLFAAASGIKKFVPPPSHANVTSWIDYEAFIAQGDIKFDFSNAVRDEWQAIALNYTSGTTALPKGVVIHHRGAYLNSLGSVMNFNEGMQMHPVYLWTLPQFHCNGWCFTWAITMLAGTHVCLRKFDGPIIWQAIHENEVTHLCGAPIVMMMILSTPEEIKKKFPAKRKFQMMTAGAAPPASVLGQMEKLGVKVAHVYGLTETYGPATVCAEQDFWPQMTDKDRAEFRARQGVRYHVLSELSVRNPENMELLPSDGNTMGEIMFRGNIVMKGYLKNEKATNESFAGGHFHSGDLGVMHGDNYIQLKDRSKDIIISGGENISSLEVENTIKYHPSVELVAVIAIPDEKWGEVPCAFIQLAPGKTATEDEIINFCKENMARFKIPKKVVFTTIPTTSTGKIQKFKLRDAVKSQSAKL